MWETLFLTMSVCLSVSLSVCLSLSLTLIFLTVKALIFSFSLGVHIPNYADHLFTCRWQPLIFCEARIWTWCLWGHLPSQAFDTPGPVAVTLCEKYILVCLSVRPLYTVVSTDQSTSLFTLNLIETIWIFLAWITCYNIYLVSSYLNCFLNKSIEYHCFI